MFVRIVSSDARTRFCARTHRRRRTANEASKDDNKNRRTIDGSYGERGDARGSGREQQRVAIGSGGSATGTIDEHDDDDEADEQRVLPDARDRGCVGHVGRSNRVAQPEK